MMPKRHRPYLLAFRRQMIELVRRGRSPTGAIWPTNPVQPTALSAQPIRLVLKGKPA